MALPDEVIGPVRLAFVVTVAAFPVQLVAAIVPLPDAARDAPVPTTIAAVVFVPPVSDENAAAPAPAEITPAEIVIDVPSIFTPPRTVVDAVGSEYPPALNCVQVPGEPAVVQIQNDPVLSTMKSPITNVPDAGAPLAVPPTYLLAPVAPVNPLEI